jgi:hypothetical protein
VRVRAPAGALCLKVAGEYPYAGHVTYTVVGAPLMAPWSGPKVDTVAASGTPTIAPWRLRFFVPPGVDAKSFVVKKGDAALGTKLENGFVVVETSLAAEDALSVDFTITLASESAKYPTEFPAERHFMHGPLLLGAETNVAIAMPATADLTYLGAGRYQCRRTQVLLTPIDGLTYLPEAVARTRSLQAVFSR